MKLLPPSPKKNKKKMSNGVLPPLVLTVFTFPAEVQFLRHRFVFLVGPNEEEDFFAWSFYMKRRDEKGYVSYDHNAVTLVDLAQALVDHSVDINVTFAPLAEGNLELCSLPQHPATSFTIYPTAVADQDQDVVISPLRSNSNHPSAAKPPRISVQQETRIPAPTQVTRPIMNKNLDDDEESFAQSNHNSFEAYSHQGSAFFDQEQDQANDNESEDDFDLGDSASVLAPSQSTASMRQCGGRRDPNASQKRQRSDPRVRFSSGSSVDELLDALFAGNFHLVFENIKAMGDGWISEFQHILNTVNSTAISSHLEKKFKAAVSTLVAILEILGCIVEETNETSLVAASDTAPRTITATLRAATREAAWALAVRETAILQSARPDRSLVFAQSTFAANNVQTSFSIIAADLEEFIIRHVMNVGYTRFDSVGTLFLSFNKILIQNAKLAANLSAANHNQQRSRSQDQSNRRQPRRPYRNGGSGNWGGKQQRKSNWKNNQNKSDSGDGGNKSGGNRRS